MWKLFNGSLPAVFSFLLLVPGESTHRADFLVVENAGRLVFYNKYQQQPGERERSMMRPYSAMRIIKKDDVLGDGFTHYMQVEVQEEQVYLLKDNDGNLAGSGALGKIQLYTGVTVSYDTIRVITPISSSLGRLHPGGKLFRIFHNNKGMYIHTISSNPSYGWIDLSERKQGRDWDVVKSSPSRTGTGPVPETITRNIRMKLDETNRVLARLFEHFNSQSGQTRQAPRWKLAHSGNAIVCTLEGAAAGEAFRESTLRLANEIETLVLGAGLQVSSVPGRIEIMSQ